MSSLIARGSVWYLVWIDTDGKQHKKTTRIKVKDDPGGKIARQIQRDHDSRQAKQLAGLEDESITIKDGLERHLQTLKQTSKEYQRDSRARATRLISFFKDLGIIHFDQIDSKHINQLIDARAGQGMAKKTIKYDIDQLKSAAKMANKSRKIRPIPFESWPNISRTISDKPDTVGAYTLEEVEKLLKYLSEKTRQKQCYHWHEPVKLLAFTGCRWGELEALKVGDVFLKSNPPMIRVESHKTARSRKEQHRFIEVHPEILPVLEKHCEGKSPSELLMKMPDRHNINRILLRACKKLDIRYKRLHGFRHFWITSLLSAGVPIAIVMTVAGHRNLSTTQGYLHIDPRQSGYIQNLKSVHESVHDF
ncbi:MAG: site-specific integrase [Candidatus Riflebacteria bacterium]